MYLEVAFNDPNKKVQNLYIYKEILKTSEVIQTTTYTTIDGYRYGFNGQERDDQISGDGNSYTAEFWQYSSRLGRRWNIDPVVKPYRSPYDAFSNNPIIMIDPKGDDDYFNADGSYNEEKSKQHKKDGQKIWVLSADGTGKKLLSDMPLQTESDKAVVLKIFDMYARKLGIQNIKLSNKEGVPEHAVAYTENNTQTYISIPGGKISNSLSNYYDLMSTLEHEKIHKEKTLDDFGMGHAKVYLEQTKGDYFGKTTKEYKDKFVSSVIRYLAEGLLEFETKKTVDEFLDEFNNQNEKILGYKIEYVGKGEYNDHTKLTFKANGKNISYIYNESSKTLEREKLKK